MCGRNTKTFTQFPTSYASFGLFLLFIHSAGVKGPGHDEVGNVNRCPPLDSLLRQTENVAERRRRNVFQVARRASVIKKRRFSKTRFDLAGLTNHIGERKESEASVMFLPDDQHHPHRHTGQFALERCQFTF